MKTTAITIKPIVLDENKCIKSNAILSIYQPKNQFNGGSIKWFDDSLLLKKSEVIA